MVKNKRFSGSKGFKAILVGAAIVMFWRGTWGLLDLYLFPDNQELSFVVSLLSGLLLVFFLAGKNFDLLD